MIKKTIQLIRKQETKAQTAIEYTLIFAVVAIIVFIGFRSLLPRANTGAKLFFNKAAIGIMGEPPPVP